MSSLLTCCLGLRIRDLLLLSLSFPSLSTAAPVRDASTFSTGLECLTILLIFSAVCLLAFKFFFVRHRRTNNLRGLPPKLVRGQCVHKGFGFLGFLAYATKENRKAGFLVGFLGSPSFEIRSKPSELTLIYPAATDTSRSLQRHDLSGDSSMTHKTKSSTFSTGPAILFNEKAPWSSCGQALVRKSSTPSASLARSTRSRFSLPTRLSFDLGRIGRKKKTTQTLLPDQDLPWPHNHLERATLRLVNLYGVKPDPEASSPFYKDTEVAPGLPSPVPPVHSFAVAHLNHPRPLPISSLPSLPLHLSDNLNEGIGVRPHDLEIDHSYNNTLLNLIKPGRRGSQRASLSPNLSVIEETCYTSLPDLASASDRPVVTAPAIGQSQNNPPDKSPPTIFSAYDTLKRKEKQGSSLLRNRRSPPLGPSPLRSMILPDVAEDENLLPKHTTVDDIKDCPLSRRRSIQYHHIGLGLPSVKHSPQSREKIRYSNLRGDSYDGNRESMLDFLRELVEETKDWDESIVLDEGFRNMIHRSQAVLGCTSLENVNIKCSVPKLQSGPGGRNKTPPRFLSFWLEDSPSP